MIPSEQIEQIRQATDIVQFLGEYVRLKKRGRRFLGLCPFHAERTPSFTVSQDKQLYHCFGCGKGGTVFTFLQEHEHMPFIEAVRFLAQRANISLREERGSDQQRDQLEKIAYAHQVASDYFHSLLFQDKYRQVLDTYVRTKRGMTDESIKEFKLGLAGESWDGLIQYASKKELTGEDLIQAGLALRSETKGTIFDRFRQRLMIPIYNLSNKPIAFGGRTLKKGETVKYMNSPETPLYSKSNVLYGLNHSRDHIRTAQSAFVVEGYFDFISLWQVGVKNVVASSGTAFTLQQARLLARFAEEVYLFFDADTAGQQAALRSVDALFEAGLEVKVITAPAGEDPDSVAKKQGRDVILKLQQDALRYIEFRTRELELRESRDISKEQLVKELSILGNRIGDSTRRGLFFSEVSFNLKVDISKLQLRRISQVDKINAPLNRNKYPTTEFALLSILTNNPGSIDEVFVHIDATDFASRELARAYTAMRTQYEHQGTINVRDLIDNAQDSKFAVLLAEIAAEEWDHAIIDSEAKKLLTELKETKLKRLRSPLLNELIRAEKAKDEQRAKEIIDEMKKLGMYVKSAGD